MFNARRSKSCQRPARADDDYYYGNNGGGGGDEDNMGDLRETIAHLKESVMTHANSSAETMEQFANLQKAHDNLYGDYTRLQEQMDDAVELLKYLKEDKSNYEVKVVDMTAELEVLRKESKNIANLNATNSQLVTKIESLEKSNKEARSSLTKQQLEYETTLSNFLKERGELLEKVKTLEQESTSRENKKVEDLNNKLATSLEKIAQLQRERRILSLSQTNESSSSTNALMEKMNQRIEHLERDNRELLQETKDMKCKCQYMMYCVTPCLPLCHYLLGGIIFTFGILSFFHCILHDSICDNDGRSTHEKR
jgi:chromosome segregation ATPase